MTTLNMIFTLGFLCLARCFQNGKIKAGTLVLIATQLPAAGLAQTTESALNELLIKHRAPNTLNGSSGQRACAYRDAFHVPPQLRKEAEPFQWGELVVSTPVRLRVLNNVSSRTHAGERIELEVVEDVLVDGFPVIRKGAEAWGTVTQTKRPGMSVEWIVYDDNPNLPEPIFGHKGEFAAVQFTGGRLSFQIEGAYDITGGEVPLHAADVLQGEDTVPATAIDAGIVMGWEVLRLPLQKLSGKGMHSFAGHHAVLRKDTEIEALVGAAVCYDEGLLARVREMQLTQAGGNATAKSQVESDSHVTLRSSEGARRAEPTHAAGENLTVNGETQNSAPLDLSPTAPTSQANLAAAVRHYLAVSRLRKAAEQGDKEAQYELAVMYQGGEGVPKDEVKAAYWFHKAAEQGFFNAQDSLRVTYRDGKLPTSIAESPAIGDF